MSRAENLISLWEAKAFLLEVGVRSFVKWVNMEGIFFLGRGRGGAWFLTGRVRPELQRRVCTLGEGYKDPGTLSWGPNSPATEEAPALGMLPDAVKQLLPVGEGCWRGCAAAGACQEGSAGWGTTAGTFLRQLGRKWRRHVL